MFNLVSAIAAWRRQLAASGVLAPDALDELESHLREEIEHLEQAGQSTEHSFHLGVQKLGQAAALQMEFARAAGPGQGGLLLRTLTLICAAILTLVGGWIIIEFDSAGWPRAFGAGGLTLIVLYLVFLPALGPSLFNSAKFRVAFKCAALFLAPLWVILLLLSASGIDLLPASLSIQMVFWSFFAAFGLTAFAAVRSQAVGQTGIPSAILESLSLSALQSLGAARERASAWNHNFLGTEHLLLGLLETDSPKILAVLKQRHLDGPQLLSRIQDLVGVEPAAAGASTPAPFTPRAREALRLAAAEAHARRHEAISVEDIFLALLQEGSGVAALVLKRSGLDLESARNELF